MSGAAVQRVIRSPMEMEQFGGELAGHCPPGIRIHLQGELGAGKTTLARGFLRQLGFTGTVRSPTYTLAEEYSIGPHRVTHFDLYRLGSAEELESVGIRDYLDGNRICLVEWPERAADLLPPADLHIKLLVEADSRRLELHAGTTAGEQCLAALASAAE